MIQTTTTNQPNSLSETLQQLLLVATDLQLANKAIYRRSQPNRSESSVGKSCPCVTHRLFGCVRNYNIRVCVLRKKKKTTENLKTRMEITCVCEWGKHTYVSARMSGVRRGKKDGKVVSCRASAARPENRSSALIRREIGGKYRTWFPTKAGKPDWRHESCSENTTCQPGRGILVGIGNHTVGLSVQKLLRFLYISLL